MIINLTQKLIDHDLQQYAKGKRTELVSDERTGLYVEVRPSGNGVGTYYLRYKDNNGKSCHERLGRTNEITLAEARQKVATFKLELDKSPDVSKTTPIKNSNMLLRDFFVEYLAFAKSTKRSWLRDEQLWRLRILPKFGNCKLSEITVRQIQALMMDIRKEGLSAATADHHGQLFRRMGNLAVKWGYIDVNFARGIQLYHEFNQVENIPTDEEMTRLIHVLRTDPNKAICLIVLFLLNTGCRLGEALKAKWQDISIENKVWKVPHQSSKSKRPRQVVLTEAALNLLKQVKRKDTDLYVFTNPKTNRPYTQIFKPWDRIRNEAGLPNLRLHDLRHSFASILINSGCTLFEVSQLLGHADTRVTQRYTHISTDTMLSAASSVSDKLSQLMQPKPALVKSDKVA